MNGIKISWHPNIKGRGVGLACLLFMFSANEGKAATIAGNLFGGTAMAGAGIDQTGSNIVVRGPGNTSAAMRGTADVMVSLMPGQLTIYEINAQLDSATWTGSGSFINPSTFQTVNISLSITTNPTSFTLQNNWALPLTPNGNGGLEWNERSIGLIGDASPFVFSGTFTLTGPTEVVTGSFSHTLGSSDVLTEGTLYPSGFPDSIELDGGFSVNFGRVDVPMVNATVDGIHIISQFNSIRAGRGVDFGRFGPTTEFTAIPEPSTGAILASSLVLLFCNCRRRCGSLARHS